MLAGYDIYNQLCITCHGVDLKGAANEDGSLNAPTLIGSPRVTGSKEILTKILLNGLIGKVDGHDYGIMMPLKSNPNGWLANVMTYVRSMNDKDAISNQLVRKVREQTKDKETYWTLEELNK